jgi:hypothetical protein
MRIDESGKNCGFTEVMYVGISGYLTDGREAFNFPIAY